MKTNLEEFIKKDKCIYTFYSAKKIYLAYFPNKVVLLEKNDSFTNKKKTVSLCSRETVVTYKETNLVLYSNKG